MDTETFALLLVQKVTLVGLIRFLHIRGILDQNTMIDFLKSAAEASAENEDELSVRLNLGLQGMIASILNEHEWRPTIISGGKQ